MTKYIITSATLEQLGAYLLQLEYYLENVRFEEETADIDADKAKAMAMLSDFKSDVASHIRELEECPNTP